MSWFRRSAALAVLGTSLVSIARAQGAGAGGLEDPAVPHDLAIALLSMNRPIGSYPDAQIWVGEVPQNLSRQLYVPPAATVLGGAGGGSTMAAVVRYPVAYEPLRASLRRELAQLGWTIPPEFGYGGGFRPLPPPRDTTAFPSTLCQGTSVLTLSVTRREVAATTVVLQVSSGSGYGLCTRPTVMSTSGYQRPPFPTLFYPPGISYPSTPVCSAAMTGSAGTSGTIQTTKTGAELLDHFAKQLADSGWTPTGDNAAYAVGTWTRPDSTGAKVELTVTVRGMAGGQGCRELEMRVRTPRP
ncbi:MAG TPA: hypothetical protein VG916_10705 [Gemmatimonadaceae bacterium]|nr:hypothetical protein [Gemmatimonadaceae bacterium]